MKNPNKVAALVVAVMAVFAVCLAVIGQPTVEEEETVYDLYRPYGDIYCHIGDTVTFEAEVIPYFEAEVIGDEGEPEESDEEEIEEIEEEEAEGENEAREIDLAEFQFQWYYCQHIETTGEIIYVPIEGANESSYTIDRVTEANLYDNDELEYLLALFPADETDLSYGNRINISSIWFCLTVLPDYVNANEAQRVVLDPAGESSKGDFVAFASDEPGEFEVSVDGVDANGGLGIYIATIYNNAVVAEDDFEVDGSFSYEFDPACSYILNWYSESDGPVRFTYTISGDAGEPYWFSASDPEPNGASLNVYVSEITIRSDGEYQITVENPWVDAEYEIDDENVATVSDDGKIWAVAPGEAVVTVHQGGESAEIALSVV